MLEKAKLVSDKSRIVFIRKIWGIPRICRHERCQMEAEN